MLKWMRKKSLVFSSSLVLAIIFVILIVLMNSLSYYAQRQAVFKEFTTIGDKLHKQALANASLIAAAGEALKTGQTPPESDMEILKRLLNAMTEDDFLANAYYLSSDYTELEDQAEIKLLQISESMETLGMSAGSNYIAHADFFEAYQKALNNHAGLTDMYVDEYGEWIAYLAPIKDASGNTIAVMGLDYDYDKVSDQLNLLLLQNSAFAIIVSILAIALVIVLIRATIKPLRALVVQAKAAAGGDLTVKVPVSGENEIGQAGKAFNEMITSLRELTIHIEKTSTEVSQSSIALKETAGQTESAANEISTAIQNVASGAETQLVSSQECQRAMTGNGNRHTTNC